MIRRIIATLAVVGLLAVAGSSEARNFPRKGKGQPTSSCAISSVSLSGNSFAGGAASGTTIGTASASTTGTCASASWTISGSDAASFQFVGAVLKTNGVVAAGSYSINIIATISGATGSPATQPETITGNAAPAAVAGWWASDNNFTSAYFGATGGSAFPGFFNGTTTTEWARGQTTPFGDWVDKNGADQGTMSYASSCSGALNSSCQSPRDDAIQTWNMPILQLVQEAVASDNQQLELFIRDTTNQGRSITSRSSGTPPHINITYSDTSTATLTCLDNVVLIAGDVPQATGPFSLSTNLALHFQMPDSNKTVTAATLVVTATATQFGGTATIKVFRIDEPLYPLGIDGLGVTQGYAQAYTNDSGIDANAKTFAYFDGAAVEGAGGMYAQTGLNSDILSNWDFGLSPDTAKLPWVTLGKFTLSTDAQYGMVRLTGTVTSGSKTVTGLASTASLIAAYWAYDPSGKVPIDTKIQSVDSGTQVTLDTNATASGSVAFQFLPHAQAIYLSGDTTASSTTISNISDTSTLANGMYVASLRGDQTFKGGYFDWPTTITVVDAHTVTTSHSANITGTAVSLMFVTPTAEMTGQGGSYPIAVPDTYTGNGYAPLYAGAGAVMIRVEPGQGDIQNAEYYFVPTTDGNPASTYSPAVTASGSGVNISQTRNLTMDGSTNGFSCTSGSPTVTVHDPSHGAATGDWVQIPVQVYVCGIILHDWYKITVTDANHYTITSTGVWWYNYAAGTQVNATASVTDGGAVPTLTTTNGSGLVVVTTPTTHAQNPQHYDNYMWDAGNLTIHNVVITSTGYKSIDTGCLLSFNASCSSSTTTQDANFSATTFSLGVYGGEISGTANATGTQGINCASQVDGCTGRAIVRYQATGTVPWPTGTTPEELYVRFYMRQHLTGAIPDYSACNGGKWSLGTAHRTSVSSNGGSCACVTPAVKPENHFAGANGWSGRNQFKLGDVPDTPEYGRLMLGTYQYNYNDCQNDYGYQTRAAWPADEWHLVEVRTKMNTYNTAGTGVHGAAPTDGLVEAWFDGVKTFTKAFKWREQPPYDQMRSTNDLQVIGHDAIKSVWFNSYFGGVCGVVFEGAFFITHPVISDHYIGPMGP